MKNVMLEYLYRDGANYKNWGNIILSNDEGLQLDAVSKLLQGAFLPDGLFIAAQIRLPELFLTEEYPISPDDHCFHEFYSVRATSELITDQHNRSLQEFLLEVLSESGRGWRAFDPQFIGLPARASIP
jgi:hypothetical protein